MKTIWIFLFAVTWVTVSCSSRIPRENPDGTPTTPSVIMPEVVAVTEIASAITDYMGNVVRKISGHIYCGEGLSQRPANRARIDLVEKKKILLTVTSDMDGTYTLSYQPGIKENFQFSISASCGSIKESLNKDLIKNSTPVDFWIK